MDTNKETVDKMEAKEEVKNEWSPEQDSALESLVSVHGTTDWNSISDRLNVSFPNSLRSARQCSQRWFELYGNEDSKKSWTEQDELSMIIAHKKHKNRWADISEALKGRSNNTIKNKFYSVFRKIRGKILKSDCSYVSKLELLEIHYIISLIEQYLAHPTSTPKTKGKRGKDFIYSLIHSLNDKMVADYKQKFKELTKDEGTMDELFNKLSAQLKASTEKPAQQPEKTQTQVQHPRIQPERLPLQPQLLPPPIKAIPIADSNRIKMKNIEQNKEEAKSDDATKSRESKLVCDPVRIEDDRLFNGSPFMKEQIVDGSPLFGYGLASPPFLFSPPCLSAGPAAAAAGARRAACFGHNINDFSEFSSVAKSLNERPRTVSILSTRPPQIPINKSPISRSGQYPVLMPNQPQMYPSPIQRPNFTLHN